MIAEAPVTLPLVLPEPREFEDLGVNQGLVLDLALKEIYAERSPTALGVSRALALPFHLTERILDSARTESYIHAVRSDGYLEHQVQYSLTERGQEKVKECLARCQYRGPVPVPLSQYCDIVRRQTIHKHTVLREDLERGLSDLVLSQEVLDQVGPGINSGRSLFLYGASGNGKSSIATHLRNVLGGEVLVPHAIEINGQIVKVLDPTIHEVKVSKQVEDRRMDPERKYLKPQGQEARHDLRWEICARPVVIVGGELTLSQLEFQYDTHLRYHQAPLHMKAAGGLLVIDDFGRQRVSPRDLLNRWIVPMDRGVDYLPLPTGETIEVPFDLLLVFSTNLRPQDVIDEAFVRRLRHKVFIPNPTPEQFTVLFFREAAARGLDMPHELSDYVIEKYYRQAGREMRCCHARDILSNVDDIRRYEGDTSPLTLDNLVRAADAYFLFEEGGAGVVTPT
ncbi:MAG: ATP-binding protein [Dehalococcoidia bacterium]|nr:ATP-binding protein [Dehalococcoidia bacterium]